MTTLHTHNQRRKRAMKRALGFTIGPKRWKGILRRQMKKEMKRIFRESIPKFITPEARALWDTKRYMK